jgi:aminopeptidase
MNDPRFSQLAHLLVNHSARVTPGDFCLIEATEIPPDFTTTLIDSIFKAGGFPIVQTHQDPIRRAILLNGARAQFQAMADLDLARMKKMQCFFGLRGSHNTAEFSDVPREKMDLHDRLYSHPVHMQQRVKHTRWVILRWPHPSMAQAANMSTPAFEDFYFRVCAGVDYPRMEQAMKPLQNLLNRTDAVHITGPGTDLRFSIKGIGSKPCFGRRNIPDGECFTCPVKDSVEGHVQFNCETLYRGQLFNRIRLAFQQGRIVEASADSDDNTHKLNEILDTDPGARYIGEWSLAFNPHIEKPMKDILFDEKIAGSFHLTPGQAYEEANNGNTSAIHWDMVCIQRPDFGGGQIEFDGQLIRKDGLFVADQLRGLNPHALGLAAA